MPFDIFVPNTTRLGTVMNYVYNIVQFCLVRYRTTTETDSKRSKASTEDKHSSNGVVPSSL